MDFICHLFRFRKLLLLVLFLCRQFAICLLIGILCFGICHLIVVRIQKFQLADTGISPGSGVHNARKELSPQTLGVPVVSLGVPTVVDASTLAADLLEDGSGLEDRRQIFQPRGEAMIVTPREIDLLIQRASYTAALAVNKALHPRVAVEDLQFLLN